MYSAPGEMGFLRGKRAVNAAALLGCVSTLALGSSLAHAQVQEVLITGSLIAGTASVGVPVTAVGTEEFQETGAITIADMLLGVPAIEVDASLNLVNRGGGGTSYGQNIEIHGFTGSGSDPIALLLINGRRWPIQGHGGDHVDPSIIPQLAVERVDILTAGASAVYGADAIVGVINVILKRNYEGAISQFTASRSVDIGQGFKVSASHLHGVSWDTGNITLTGEAYFHQRMQASALEGLYTSNFEDTLGYDVTPIALSMPGVVTTGNPQNAPGTPAGFSARTGTRFCNNCYALPYGIGWEYGTQAPGPTADWNADIVPNKFIVGERNEQNQRISYEDAWALPQQTREAFVGALNQKITDDFFGLGEVELHGTTFYSNRQGQMHFGINLAQGNSAEHANFRQANGFLVPTNNPYRPTNAPGTIRMQLNFSPLLGTTSRINFQNIATRYEFGFNFNSLPFDWVGDTYYSMSTERNQTLSTGMINVERARAAMGETIPGTDDYAAFTKPDAIPYLNVFCDALTWGTSCNSPETLDYITGFRLQENLWRIRQMGANFSGPIFELPSGQVLLALSAEHLSQHYWFSDVGNAQATPGNGGVQGAQDVAKRVSHAFFGELAVPLIGGQWSFPGMEALDLQLGYRVDKYDFLDEYVKTPKIAANWTVGWGLVLRGAWGKSFRAPGFGQSSAIQGSRVESANVSTNTFEFRCVNLPGAPAGSATEAINPGCLSDPGSEGIYAPNGLNVVGGSGLGDYIRGLSQDLRPGGPPKGLKPETSKQYMFGLNYAPQEGWFQGLNLDVSYFHIKIEDTIRADTSGDEDGAFIGDNPLARHRFVIRPSLANPAADDTEFDAIIAQLAALPGSVFDSTLQYDFLFDDANTNLGYIQLQGIDFDARYDWDMGAWGTWHIGTAGYFEIDQETKVNDASPIDSLYEGKNSGHQLKRLRSRIGWSDGTFGVTLFNMWRGHEGRNTNLALPQCFWAETAGPGSCYTDSPYFPQAGNANGNPDQGFYNVSPGWMQWDLNLTYNTGAMPTNEYLHGINVSLTVNNILDEDPPFSYNSRVRGNEVRAFDGRFSELGRFVSLTVTKEW